MNEMTYLVKKATQTFKNEGIGMLARKTKRYLEFRLSSAEIKKRNMPDRTFADVLFINGCSLPHPSRYRVTHQREQLLAGTVSNNEVFFTELDLDMVRLYRVFIFYRCPYTEVIGNFIKLAKEQNKVVLYDIDDLLIDRSYTDTVAYLKTMPETELNSYYEGIERNQKVLKMCDGAITTTERLATELKKFVPEVYINRNVASEEMLMISDQVLEDVKRKKSNDEVIRIGYFSGSITHNADIQMILPAILKLLEENNNLRFCICGELSLPDELKHLQKQVEYFPFGDWKKLPEMIARVDINIAPLEQSVFNEAKSENKWTEAALVKVPTIASNVGAFAHMIQDGETGILCENTIEDWYCKLTDLIKKSDYRKKIGEQAYLYCRKNCTSVYTAAKFSSYIKKIMKPNIMFILPVMQISGGILVILEHIDILKRNGYDVCILNQGDETDKWIKKNKKEIAVISEKDITIAAQIDKAVASLWTTVSFFDIYPNIIKKYYLVQGFETDFSKPGNGFRICANRTYCMENNLNYITVSKWCQRWLKEDYGKEASYAPNGLDTKLFWPQKRKFDNRKIRILIEGNCEDYFKNVDESFKIVELLDKDRFEIWYLSYQGEPRDWYYVDRFLHKVPHDEVPNIYRECDILIKSSILESFSYPPIEMMSTGGYVVVAPNEGNCEYLRDGENCLFYKHEDLRTAVKAVEQLSTDSELRDRIYNNGIKTAAGREWARIESDILMLYEEKTNEV